MEKTYQTFGIKKNDKECLFNLIKKVGKYIQKII